MLKIICHFISKDSEWNVHGESFCGIASKSISGQT